MVIKSISFLTIYLYYLFCYKGIHLIQRFALKIIIIWKHRGTWGNKEYLTFGRL